MHKFAFASILAVPAVALAQFTPVDPFVGDLQEGFDTIPFPLFEPSFSIFDDQADVFSTVGSMHATPGWGFSCTIRAFEGTQLAASTGGPARFEFDEDITAFGGYFGSNAPAGGADGVATFFDRSGAVIGEDTLEIADNCEWTWNGWEFDQGVATIEIASGYSDGDYAQMDALELSFGVACRADFNMDGALDIFDFLAFQNAFDAGDLAADFNDDGVLDIFDFLAFQNAFDAGCD